MAVKIQLRRGTAAQWTAANPVLAEGEVGVETDTRKTKYGDGVTAWNALPYASGSDADVSTLSGALPSAVDAGAAQVTATGSTTPLPLSQIAAQHGLSVLAFGADPSGVADSTPAFERAEAALPAGGGTILVPNGTFTVSYRIRKPYVTLRGASWASILRTPAGATALGNDATVRILAHHVTVEGLQIDGNRANNAAIDDFTLGRQADGVGIYADFATVRNNYIRDIIGHKIIVWNEAFTDAGPVGGGAAASSVNTARTGFHIDGNLVTTAGQRAAIDVASTQNGTIDDTKVNHKGVIIGNHVYDQPIVCHTAYDVDIIGNVVYSAGTDLGISIHTGSARVNIVGNVISGSSQGILLDGTNKRLVGITVRGNQVTNTAGLGISALKTDQTQIDGNYVQSTGSGAPGINYQDSSDLSITNNRVYASGSRGIYNAGSEACLRVVISGNTIVSPATYGLEIANTQGGLISGNYLYGGTAAVLATNASAARIRFSGNVIDTFSSTGLTWYVDDSDVTDNTFRSITGDAIRIDNAPNVNVIGNRFIACAAQGVRTMSAAASATVVRDNDLRGVTGTKVTAQSDTIVSRNLGYVTEATGTATVASGATSVNVTHGLSATPALSTIRISPTNDLGNAAKAWVSAVGSSTFTITVNADPGASTATFAWQVTQ